MATHKSTKRTHTPKPNKGATAKKQAERKPVVEQDPSELHKALAEYIKSKTGYDADVKTVQLALSLRPQFNKAPERAQAREQAKQVRELQKQDRAKKQEERKAKALERLAKQAEKLGVSIQTVQAQKNK